ncbi:MAG: tetratricopeptide repeat protein [Proteobacteria bacterium]|nr:tetratricopeptide repeat protein [Pseudomonadota bacterium]
MADVNETLRLAMGHHQQGRTDKAESLYRQILDAEPNHAEANHLLGVAASQRGDFDLAVRLIGKAIESAPKDAIFHNNLGNVQREQGRLDDAVASYAAALDITPNLAEAHYNTGNIHTLQDRPEAAAACYRKALAIKPDYIEAMANLGTVLKELGHPEEAVACFESALRSRPDLAEVHFNLGNTLRDLGRLEDAVNSYQTAITAKPDYAEAHSSLGTALAQLGRLEDAVIAHQKALRLRPDYAEALSNLGIAYDKLGLLGDAAAAYEKAISIKPDLAAAHSNYGNVLKQQGRLGDAVASYEKALAITPNYTEALGNLGAAYNQMGRNSDAAASLRAAIATNPDYAEAHYNLGNALDGQLAETLNCYREAARLDKGHQFARASLLHQLQHACAWAEFKDLEADVDAAMRAALDQGGGVAVTPFALVTRRGDGAENLAVAKAASNETAKQMAGLGAIFSETGPRQPKTRVTIGYLSADFHNHATAHLMRGLFECHDREAFRILAFSHGPDDGSDYRRAIEANCDGFVDIAGDSHGDAAKRIVAAGVDILIDLKGHTDQNRLQICALRPAPIQASYLGFPGTSGADFLDYILTDAVVTPAADAPYYTEAFVTLPHCYQATDNTQKISDAPLRRSDFGLPDDGFVFCSFNATYKIEPKMFDVWMRLLDNVPGSVLWLLKSNDLAEKNLKAEAEARGIDAGRLIFADKIPKDRHLARHRLADLALDTRICGGHTTTTDALWAGLPVVTLAGNHFVSRVASSLLQAVAMPELVSHSLEAYEALARGLAKDNDKLTATAEKLGMNRLSEPLFDTPRFTRNLETAYRLMWDRYLAGEAPAPITVTED